MCGASAVFARRARFFFAAGVRVVTESREPKTRRYPVQRTASLWLRLDFVARCEPARKSCGGQRTSKGRRQAHANHAEGARQSTRLSRTPGGSGYASNAAGRRPPEIRGTASTAFGDRVN